MAKILVIDYPEEGKFIIMDSQLEISSEQVSIYLGTLNPMEIVEITSLSGNFDAVAKCRWGEDQMASFEEVK